MSVLMAHPAVLVDLVVRYASLEAQLVEGDDVASGTRQKLADTAYTLCVSTGTRDVDAALVAARHRLPGARTPDDSVLSPCAARLAAPARGGTDRRLSG